MVLFDFVLLCFILLVFIWFLLQDFDTESLTSDRFEFTTGQQALLSKNLSRAATIDLPLVPPYTTNSPMEGWLATYKSEFDPVSAPGYFDSYTSAGYYADKNEQVVVKFLQAGIN